MRPVLGWVAAGAVLAAAVAAAAWARARTPADSEVRQVERAYAALRDAILRDDDEAFFALHSRRAREDAVKRFPLIRSQYLSSPSSEREAFQAMNRITEKEFLEGDPEGLVVRLAPWWSGWRARRDVFAVARVKDVRIQQVPLPDGVLERRGIVSLDIREALAPGEAEKVPENFLPTVVFVKEPEGWRRREFEGR